MREIICPTCDGDGYQESIRGDQAYDKRPCEKCGGDGKLVDDVSPCMLSLANDIDEIYKDMDDIYDDDFDDGAVKELLLDLGSALYEIQSILKARCK